MSSSHNPLFCGGVIIITHEWLVCSSPFISVLFLSFIVLDTWNSKKKQIYTSCLQMVFLPSTEKKIPFFVVANTYVCLNRCLIEPKIFGIKILLLKRMLMWPFFFIVGGKCLIFWKCWNSIVYDPARNFLILKLLILQESGTDPDHLNIA